jgi:hypothetical protein
MAAEFQLPPARWEGGMNVPFTTRIRTAPHNIEAEQALLGAILVNNEAFCRVSDFLEPKHFFEPIHQRISELASELIRAGKLATPVPLKTFLPADLDIARLTVNRCLARLTAEATTIINAEHSGRTTYYLSIRRGLILSSRRSTRSSGSRSNSTKFIPRSLAEVFSTIVAILTLNTEIHQRACDQWGTLFTPRRGSGGTAHTFCSRACQRPSNRERRRTQRIASYAGQTTLPPIEPPQDEALPREHPGKTPVLDIANYERTDFVVADTRVETWPPKVRVSRWVEEVRSRVEAAAAILAKGSAS